MMKKQLINVLGEKEGYHFVFYLAPRIEAE